MKLPFSVSQLKSFVTQLAAIAGLFVSIANTDHLPTSVRTALAGASGFLITVEHYINRVGN